MVESVSARLGVDQEEQLHGNLPREIAGKIEIAALDIKQLRFLIALEREKHFGRAADACFVSQPTLSARIRLLEQELGVLIVERHSHNYHGFTEEGMRILQRARRIVADCDAMLQDVSALQDNLTGTLSIGVIPSALPLVSSVTTQFQKLYPAVRINVLARSSMEIQRGLDDFDLEAGISYIDNEPLKNVRQLPMHEECYVLLTGQQVDVGDATEQISWANAANLPLCLLTADMQNRRILDAAFRTAHVSPTPEMETNSILALYSYVLDGRLATILPQHFVDVFGTSNKLRSIPLIEPVLNKKIGLLIADRDPPIPVAERLFATLSSLQLNLPAQDLS